MLRPRLLACLLSLALVGASQAPPPQAQWLGAPEAVAPGIDLFSVADQSLVEPAAPIAVFLLRLDPARVRLDVVRAHDEVMGMETVGSMAARRGAAAAINGGFFNTKNGDPVAALKIA
jgi:hypothetical protein